MNKRKISHAIDNVMETLTALKATLNTEAPVTLIMELTPEQLALLYEVAGLDITIPMEILRHSTITTKPKIRDLLHKIRSAVDRAR